MVPCLSCRIYAVGYWTYRDMSHLCLQGAQQALPFPGPYAISWRNSPENVQGSDTISFPYWWLRYRGCEIRGLTKTSHSGVWSWAGEGAHHVRRHTSGPRTTRFGGGIDPANA